MKAPRGTTRYWFNMVGFALIAAIVGYFVYAYLGVSYFMAKGFTHPKRMPLCCENPSDWGFDYEDANLKTKDSIIIRGWYIPSQNEAALILLHSIASNRLGTKDLAIMFATHGYGVLMIDLRTHGESGGDILTYGGDEFLDVSAGVDYLQARPEVASDKIGMMGLSLGASTGILSAAQDERLGATVADAPGAVVFKDWPKPDSIYASLYVPFDMMFFFYLHRIDGVSKPLSILDAVGQIAPRPLLLIGETTDDSTLEQRSLSRFYAAANDPKEMWIIPNTEHINGLNTHPQEYEAKVIGFFDRYLLGIKD